MRANVSKGIEIIEQLRGHTTGYAVPQFVIDAPGGGGKVPVNPDYVLMKDNQRVLIRNYEGKVFEYPEPQPSRDLEFSGNAINRIKLEWGPKAKW